MEDRYLDARRQLEKAVVEIPGETGRVLREAIAKGEGGLPPEIARFVDEVMNRAYAMADEDVAELRNKGYGEDAIFEISCCAAVTAARVRFAAAVSPKPRAARAGQCA